MNSTDESIRKRFPAPKGPPWYKGSLHVHTAESDGEVPPADVARWYKRHGYDFIVISDHDRVTPVDDLNRDFGADGTFLVLPGEEVTDSCPGPEDVPVHVNAIGISAVIAPRGGPDVVTVLRHNVEAIREARGLPVVNHPNFRWALTSDDLYPVHGWSLMEIANCGAEMNRLGFDRPGPEDIWDDLLSRGRLVYGVASDDAHHFTVFSPRHDNPGRGWVMVRCESLSVKFVIDALARGNFYPTTGVIFDELTVTPDLVRVAVQRWEYERHCIEFIGLGGAVLKTEYGSVAEYLPNGTEEYVRVRVTDSNGLQAWSQPVFLRI